MTELVKPEWIKVKYKTTPVLEAIRNDLRQNGLATVCQSSLCPNISECWGGGTATFMPMGDTCTRGCRFCNVKKSAKPGPLDSKEAEKLVSSVKRMNFTYAVLTSVDRDDLPDYGAEHLANCIRSLKNELPSLVIEILIPDFCGEKKLIRKIVEAKPDVIAHNIETIERLTHPVRDRRAGYRQSLAVLETVKRLEPAIYTKSSIMLGLGEEKKEVEKAMDDLRRVGVSFLTLGQYLRPSPKNLPVSSYIPLETFKYYEAVGFKKGFLYVASGPFVRSSYKAGEWFKKRC